MPELSECAGPGFHPPVMGSSLPHRQCRPCWGPSVSTELESVSIEHPSGILSSTCLKLFTGSTGGMPTPPTAGGHLLASPLVLGANTSGLRSLRDLLCLTL